MEPSDAVSVSWHGSVLGRTVFQQAYDRGPYARGAVDYDRPPDPPVRPELADWLKVCLER